MKHDNTFDLTGTFLSARAGPGTPKFPDNDLTSAPIAADQELATKIRRLQRARMDRTRVLSPELFGEPAWDILLELFASNLEQRRVSISGVCDASGVPSTTALRWIGILEDHKLAVRRIDPLDARRVFIMLSNAGVNAMRECFEYQMRGQTPQPC